MTDKKFTDEEIIRNYEWCIGCTSDRCRECTMDEEGFCEEELQDLVLDLIYRQKADIERLKECPKCVYEYDGEVTEYCIQGLCSNFKTVEQIKAEAYKEFAQRAKDEIRLDDDCNYNCRDCCYECNDYVIAIDNLLKEMVGEEE